MSDNEAMPHIKMQRQWLLDNITRLPRPFIYAQARALDIYKQVTDLLGEPAEADLTPHTAEVIGEVRMERRPCNGCRRRKK